MRKLSTVIVAACLMSAATSSTAFSLFSRGKPPPTLFNQLVENQSDPDVITDRFIIRFNDDRRPLSNLVKIVTDLTGVTVLSQLDQLGTAVIQGDALSASIIGRLPIVASVVQDRIVRGNVVEHLDRIDQRRLPLDGLFQHAEEAGQGVQLYILDSGLNTAHIEFTGRVGQGRNFAQGGGFTVPDSSAASNNLSGGLLGQGALRDLTQNTLGNLLRPVGELLNPDDPQPTSPPATTPAPTTPPMPTSTPMPEPTPTAPPSDGIPRTAIPPNAPYPGPGINHAAYQDCNGHGTHVTGIAAGTQTGVAKKAIIHPMRVLDCNNSGFVSSILQAVDHVMATAIRPAVMNLSIGTDRIPVLDDALAEAVASGIVVVASAGNSNADACTQSPAGPALINVGAADRDDRRASFSNFGSCVDLFAPGVSVLSAWMGSNRELAILNGTSMSSPAVAGTAAMLLSMGVPVDQVKEVIITTATENAVFNEGPGSPRLMLKVPNR